MVLAPQMRNNAVIVLKPLRALNAVVLSESWKVENILGSFVLRKVLWVKHVGLDLIEISQVSASLRARLLVRDTHFCCFVTGVKVTVVVVLCTMVLRRR